MDKFLVMNTEKFIQSCHSYLNERWASVSSQINSGTFQKPNIAALLTEKIKKILESSSKTYHYVLPTQILAKIVDPKLDCRSVQASYKKSGAFDARTVAHKVIVPFDRGNSNVLGGSTEPYVSKPLRLPAIIGSYRAQQKQKTDWDILVELLEEIETRNDIDFTKSVFDYLLFEIYNLLEEVSVLYPIPNRVSLGKTIELVNKFLSTSSGGNNEEIIATALLSTLAFHFRMFDKVESSNVNSADKASGLAADIECFVNGSVALLVEVKDQLLTLTQIERKMENARAKSITEILFLAQHGIEETEKDSIKDNIMQEFSSGHNIYTCTIIEFALGMLILLGEKGRVKFLAEVGKELDRRNSPVKHRKAWAMLLRNA